MPPSIKVSETVIKRLSTSKDQCFGRLFGIHQENNIFIISLQSDLENGLELEYAYPAGLEFCGIFQVAADTSNEDIHEKFGNTFETYNPVYLTCKIGSGNINIDIKDNEKLVKVNYSTINEQDIYNSFVNIRLKGEIPLKSELGTVSLGDAFQKIQKSFSLGVFAFGFVKSNIFLLDPETETNIIGTNGDIDVGEICEDSNSFNEESNRKKKIQRHKPRILDIDMFKPAAKLSQNGLIKEHAPLCILDKSQLTVVNMTIQVDTLAMSVVMYMQLFEDKILKLIHTSTEGKNLLLETYHFHPSELGHFLTILYPKCKTEASLKSDRQHLHRHLMLGFSSPIFRRANRYRFGNSTRVNSPLINPHEGIKATDNGGVIALVKGKYEYYHYCQNKMDDDGWGCAYRSLQTLASWFKLQGFVDKEVPNFLEIQKCLVDIKDKPASFVGSRQWIGSTEVNFVLNTLFGIENKILYVSSGAEMASKGPELLNHFQNYGSPVMIGGGVLAHTILGVDYNQQTGNLRFLILDPHYTGSEDLHVIQSKALTGFDGNLEHGQVIILVAQIPIQYTDSSRVDLENFLV
ncbi:hypothetical protein JTB14_023939 [Gonioctena quinquepunctata]|nr:hypothetical protein JTB14_023939 [Gonioctena quinquepunctata]